MKPALKASLLFAAFWVAIGMGALLVFLGNFPLVQYVAAGIFVFIAVLLAADWVKVLKDSKE